MSGTKIKKESVIVASPVQQHSFHLATALKKSGLLNKYYTTVYVRKNSIIWNVIGRIAGSGFLNSIRKKRCEEIESDTEVLCGFTGLVYYLLSRVNYRLSCGFYVSMTKRFGKKVAKKAIKYHALAVVMYDYTAVACFNYLKKNAPHIIRILDMSSAPTMSIDGILDREEKNGYGAFYTDKRLRYSKKLCKYFDREIENADYFLVAGDFVRNCLIEQGVRAEQCFYVPYGVNTDSFLPDYHMPEDSVVNFVYTGRIEAAKGILYVLEAFSKLYRDGEKFKLHLVGTLNIPKDVIDNYSDFCLLHGYLDKDSLVKLYHHSQVYVMCSLWEGRSLSIIEALSCGLPCMITASSGMSDCITEGKNGFVIPPADANAIYEKAKWFMENQNCLDEMSKKAVKSVCSMTWDGYDIAANDAVANMLAGKQTTQH